MNALARLAVRRPKHVLAAWLTVVGLLGLAGLHVENDLHQQADLSVAGSASARGDALAKSRFGQSTTIPILLDGPRSAATRQGRQLVAALQPLGVTVLAPWELRDQSVLRPRPDTTVLIVRSPASFDQTSTKLIPEIRADVDRIVRKPVRASVTGSSDIARGLHSATVDAVKRAEILAAPLLMIILLFVFRSVVAASVPLFIGITTITAGRGILDLLNNTHPLDGIGLNLMVMIGLALGVDYALLLVSRFREELDAGADPREATLITTATAGRTVLFAGIIIVTSALAVLPFSPSVLLASSITGIAVAGTISVIAALTALPATLVVLGPRINRFAVGRRAGAVAGGGVAAVALRMLSRPALATGLVLALMIALAAPATALDMGPPSPLVMPSSQRENKDFTEFAKQLRTGWTAPYEVTVASRHGPITNLKTLGALARFQEKLSQRRDVAAVMGPAEIEERTSGLEKVPKQLEAANGELHSALGDQARLEGGLGSAAGGVGELTAGLTAASTGAKQLQAGGSRAAGGAQLIAAGIGRARAGAERMRAGLATAGSGAKALQAGAQRAGAGVGRIHGGLTEARKREQSGAPQVAQLAKALDGGARDLNRLREPAQTADQQLTDAMRLLNKMLATSKVDPSYRDLYTAVATAKGAISGRNPVTGAPVRDGYGGLDSSLADASQQASKGADGVRKMSSQLTQLENGLAALESGAGKLGAGTSRLQAGLAKLSGGLDRLGGGGAQLTNGLGQLESAGQQLASGTQQLSGGANSLSQGLSSGAGRIGQLRHGLSAMQQGVQNGESKTKRLAGGLSQADQLRQITESGYFALAAIEQASPEQRRAVSFALNVDRGGNAVRYLIVGKGNVVRDGDPLRAALERNVAQLGRATGTDARLSGFAPTLQDYEHATTARFWLMVFVLSSIAFVVLVPVLRSLLLPLLAVLLTVFTVACACGVLVLCFQGSKPLGGAGFIDGAMMYGVFAIAFALSVDYQCFLLMRMREGYLKTGDTDQAVAYGLQKTARVVTGAAVAMTGVFIAFAVTPLVFTRQLGVGLTVAVLLDATLVRLVLLPAAMRLCGKACWWLPRWLERALDTRPHPFGHEGHTSAPTEPLPGTGAAT
ncbi:MAG: MMPL family transporter [Gaiellaceae bacterium]